MQDRELDNFLAGVEQRAYRIAYGALWNHDDALDVVQESMTRLVQYYRDRSEDQWIKLFHTILNSRINDARRKRLLTKAKLRLVSLTGLGQKDSEPVSGLEEAVVAEPQRTDGISSPEAQVLGGELNGKINAAMEQLSWRQRQVFMLRDEQGHSVKDTAQMLGCSETAVKQHHFRAMRTLRKLLSEVWDHD